MENVSTESNQENSKEKITKGQGGKIESNPSKHYRDRAQKEVRENEDASLQDHEYAFDSDDTHLEEYHDLDDVDPDYNFDFENEDDFLK
jgi:hypothetical protein